jgi:hypothetical protein
MSQGRVGEGSGGRRQGGKKNEVNTRENHEERNTGKGKRAVDGSGPEENTKKRTGISSRIGGPDTHGERRRFWDLPVRREVRPSRDSRTLDRSSGDEVGGGVPTSAGIAGIDFSNLVIQRMIQYSHDDIEDRRRVDSSVI